MIVEFRCEQCGKLLRLDAEPSAELACPMCNGLITVPAGVASLPRPKVPPAPPPLATAQLAMAAAEPAIDQGPAEGDALVVMMARIMPWIISLFLHASILLILGFFTIVVFAKAKDVDGGINIPDSEFAGDRPGGKINPGPANNPLLQHQSTENLNLQQGWAPKDAAIRTVSDSSGEGEASDDAAIGLPGSGGAFGGAGGGAGPPGSAGAFGFQSGGSGAGPRSRFMGLGGTAYHIVYVVDRSGSMFETFDEVRSEMLNSIIRLNGSQSFHVIFFSQGQPLENPPQRLVFATEDYKKEAIKYLKSIQAAGQTDPVPALRKAFGALSSTPGTKKGKLIYLLTDGEFSDPDGVMKQIRAMNPDKAVSINTILHVNYNEDAVKTLKQIAEENNGRFKFVPKSQ